MGEGEVVVVHLVRFEAWNIERFMFVTNKRREIAGASELITYVDFQWVGSALRGLHPGFDASWQIEKRPVELLQTGAGTADVLVRDRDEARRLVTEVTLAALEDAPGLEVCGVVTEAFDWSEPGALHAALQDAGRRMTPARTSLPGPDARFLRLPVVEDCATTGLPAAGLVPQPLDDGEEVPRWEPRSAESQAKWVAFGKEDERVGLDRLASLVGEEPRVLKQVVEYLSNGPEWMGVVYADGNGLGSVFGHFEECVEGDTNRAYADTLKGFASGLQRCAQQAFRESVAQLLDAGALLPDGGSAPVLPLILGGDDLVALCAGEWALTFTELYLRAFERLTAAAPEISGPLARRGLGPGLAMSAGVAIVKANFPFATAQTLAYQLMREAKEVKRAVHGVPCSSLSFHVLYDSTQATLPRIRGQQEFECGRLVAQPYVVSDVPDEGLGWVRGRRWQDLGRRVAALTARDEEGERRLPTSQMHDLRSSLFAGPRVADARFMNLLGRFAGRGLEELTVESESLFWHEPAVDGEGQGRLVTGLLDAMNAEGFLPESLIGGTAVLEGR
ncbi:hypothetical protein [Streptomyces sp. TS71-3]|uniref:Cas10/Cmr2 second palm domain-containing protein n=1 Tax=Streptomyces sp. TS71-3 TaxID=2733862 RepID=UPI001B0A9A4A|nr:hypothetical protein [Streptomyces sp. TS71-3]GHJ35473.1 hypothetical protein Sm713_10820 [Streptomyces sp. TS71-3]